MKAFKNAWTGINISVVVTIFTLIPLIANKTVLFLFPNLFFRNLVMSPHYSNFLKKPPLSNLSSNCSESVSVTIKIIKHKTQSAKPVGLTPPWDSVKWSPLLDLGIPSPIFCTPNHWKWSFSDRNPLFLLMLASELTTSPINFPKIAPLTLTFHSSVSSTLRFPKPTWSWKRKLVWEPV